MGDDLGGAMDTEKLQRIDAARAEVRRALAGDTMILIHPFDLAKLLGNPQTIDVVVIHVDNRQYMVIDGSAYRCTPDVRNETKLNEMLAK
jgi:hypothetical protein